MGAATAILSTTIIPGIAILERQKPDLSLDIKTLILDSPFSDLAKLAEEVVCLEVTSRWLVTPILNLPDQSAEDDAFSRRHSRPQDASEEDSEARPFRYHVRSIL